jgi:hypothetical protein
MAQDQAAGVLKVREPHIAFPVERQLDTPVSCRYLRVLAGAAGRGWDQGNTMKGG